MTPKLLKLDTVSKWKYNVVFINNSILLGELIQDVDGYFYFFLPESNNNACWTQEIIKELLHLITKLNAPNDKKNNKFWNAVKKKNEEIEQFIFNFE